MDLTVKPFFLSQEQPYTTHHVQMRQSRPRRHRFHSGDLISTPKTLASIPKIKSTQNDKCPARCKVSGGGLLLPQMTLCRPTMTLAGSQVAKLYAAVFWRVGGAESASTNNVRLFTRRSSCRFRQYSRMCATVCRLLPRSHFARRRTPNLAC
jgi:hypothetical protein